MSSAFKRGYASSRFSTDAPSASLRSRSSTGTRVPRITGLPCMTDGLISTRSVIARLVRCVSDHPRWQTGPVAAVAAVIRRNRHRGPAGAGPPLDGSPLREVAEIVVLLGDAFGRDFHNAEAGFRAAQRLAYRAGREHLQIGVASLRIAMIVPGEDVFHAELMQNPEVAPPGFRRDVEVLIRLVGLVQKQRMVLKHNQALHAVLPGLRQFGPEPRFHLGGLFGRLGGVLD